MSIGTEHEQLKGKQRRAPKEPLRRPILMICHLSTDSRKERNFKKNPQQAGLLLKPVKEGGAGWIGERVSCTWGIDGQVEGSI